MDNLNAGWVEEMEEHFNADFVKQDGHHVWWKYRDTGVKLSTIKENEHGI